MALEFKLPTLAKASSKARSFAGWSKKATCCEDQPMVEVMTDKATVEIPTPRAGRVPS